ncbi:MAG: sulfur carrier protein ThiS adenylyltransferase ThiF [Candidatus Omnitrophota bacterium]
MNDFEKKIADQLGAENLERIQAVKVGIAGAGGLGSNCAFNLARVGFKKLKIIDFDVIDHSNLNRQFYFFDQIGMDKVEALKVNLERINPDMEIEILTKKIESANVRELFSDCDIVVEAFDKAEYKSMIVSHLLDTDKFIVSASGLAGFGNCDEIKVHNMKKNFVMIGDLKSDSSENPPLSPRVNVAAAKQADVILEHVLNLGKTI